MKLLTRLDLWLCRVESRFGPFIIALPLAILALMSAVTLGYLAACLTP